jgi:predicted RNase H-like nuclease (RuvC/YqgF family)
MSDPDLEQRIKQRLQSASNVLENGTKMVENENVQNGTAEKGVRLRRKNFVEKKKKDDQSEHEANPRAAAALQRGMETLQETELEENLEEIKQLDTQLDSLNTYMDRIEDRIKKHNDKIQETLNSQKQSRLQRRQSFNQRLLEQQKEDEDFTKRIADMLNRCANTRKTSLPAQLPSMEMAQNGAVGGEQ